MLRNLFKKSRNPADPVSELEDDRTLDLPAVDAGGCCSVAACAEAPGPLGAPEALIKAARSVN